MGSVYEELYWEMTESDIQPGLRNKSNCRIQEKTEHERQLIFETGTTEYQEYAVNQKTINRPIPAVPLVRREVLKFFILCLIDKNA